MTHIVDGWLFYSPGGKGVVTICFKHVFQNGAMNASPEINIKAFLRNIPNQITEARRQLFCDNINVWCLNCNHRATVAMRFGSEMRT
jgi:hypothetical protein